MENRDKPAYPFQGNPEAAHLLNEGLSKREMIAAMCLQGLLANPEWMKEYKGEKYLMQDDVAAKIAIQKADALLTQLEKE